MADNDNRNKSMLDSLFDAAETALGGMEKALLPHADAVDVEFRTVDEKQWQDTWANHSWACCLKGKLGEAHHVIQENTMRSMCGKEFNSNDIERTILEPDKRIVACTSCIIAISKR